jgi:curved DNA-binding protein CbpA
MLLHHPDKTTDQELIERGRLIIEAYNVLGDPELRKVYDVKLREEGERVGSYTNRFYEVVEGKRNLEKCRNSIVNLECNQCEGVSEVSI